MLYYIYRISVNDHIYIGSTKDFDQRKAQHKSSCKLERGYNIYDIINKNGGWDACEMVPIEEFNCDTYMAALIREEYWRREYKANMNSKRAHQTDEEYWAQKKHHNDLANCKRDNKPQACPCGGSFGYSNKSTHLRSVKHKNYLLTLENTVSVPDNAELQEV